MIRPRGSAFGTGPARRSGLHRTLPGQAWSGTPWVRREAPPRSTRSAWRRIITERPMRRRSASPIRLRWAGGLIREKVDWGRGRGDRGWRGSGRSPVTHLATTKSISAPAAHNSNPATKTARGAVMREPWSRTGDTGEDVLRDSEHPPTSTLIGRPVRSRLLDRDRSGGDHRGLTPSPPPGGGEGFRGP
jgi:hypothetical protein